MRCNPLPQPIPDLKPGIPAELLDVFMRKLEERGLDRSEDSFRIVSTVQLLLQRFPGDMTDVFQADVILFFSKAFTSLNSLRRVCISSPTLNYLRVIQISKGLTLSLPPFFLAFVQAESLY